MSSAKIQNLQPRDFLRRSKSILCTSIDEEVVIMNTEIGKYFALDPFGSFIWTHLGEGITFEEICNQVTMRFDGAQDEIERDLQLFLLEMGEKGLVEITTRS